MDEPLPSVMDTNLENKITVPLLGSSPPQDFGVIAWDYTKVPSAKYVIYKTYSEDTNKINDLEQRVNNLEEQIRNIQELCYLKIYDLEDKTYDLREPIGVVLKKIENDYIALVPELELFVFGDNEFEVVRELKFEILDLYEDLEELSGTDMTNNIKSWKKILNKLIKKNG